MIKRLTVITGCVLALGVGVAACGDDDNDGGDGATTTEQPADTGMNQQQNIVAVAQATPDLSTLVEALSAADLVETLEEPGPYTVFAPTNESIRGARQHPQHAAQTRQQRRTDRNPHLPRSPRRTDRR